MATITPTAGDLASLQRADRIAELALKHTTNEQGQVLANVQESIGFQEVYDYHGTEKMRHRLNRKLEQVSSNYDARSHLF